jgi:hypothetical protein
MLLLLALFSVAAAQEPARDRDPDRGTGIIQGRVVAADTGLPLRRVQIRASASGVPLARFAATDGEGRFELRNLAAGQWSLTATRAGFVSQRLGQPRSAATLDPQDGRLIDVGENTLFNAADFALVRGGAINGRIFDEFSEGVPGVQVSVMRARFERGLRRLVPTGVASQTDDRGVFRVFGLSPGEYYVSATLRGNPLESSDLIPGGPGGLQADVITYAPTYYPGTGDIREAQRISLTAGEEADITFSLLPVRLATVSGTAVASNGTALGNGRVHLSVVSDTDTLELPNGVAGTVMPDGTFTLVNVPPGSYVLEIMAGIGRANTEREIASIPITVGGADVRGLTVTTNSGMTISGTVVSDRAGIRLPAGIGVRAESLRGPGITEMSAAISATGTFRLSGIRGVWALGVGGLPGGWAVKSITFDGNDVSDGPADFSADRQIFDARIVLTDVVSTVDGTVTLRGNPVTDFSVVVFPEDRAKWTYPSRYVRAVRANEQGRFSVRALPPDSRYRIVAVSHLDGGEGGDPEFLERIADIGTAFSLGEGESRSLDLTLVER